MPSSGRPLVGLMRPLAREVLGFGRRSWKEECRVWVRETGTSALSMQAFGEVSADGWGSVVLLSTVSLSVG
jgi:hypothetical protein